jgi:hypothetical protein
VFDRARRWHYQLGSPLPRTGVRIGRLNFEYLDLWTGEYSIQVTWQDASGRVRWSFGR